MPDYSPGPHPLANLCEQWLAKIAAARKRKWDEFGCYAQEAHQFYNSAHDFMWADKYARGGVGDHTGGFLGEGGFYPTFRMTVNRIFEAVAIFGPVLYNRNPNVLVTPRDPPPVAPEALGIPPLDETALQSGQVDPATMQLFFGYQALASEEQTRAAARKATAGLIQHYLEWLQYESDKKSEARLAIDEAIVKGMGTLWCEMHQPAGSRIRYPKCFFDSVDNFVVDPDANRWEDVQWVARKCCHPLWWVEREYGYAPGALKRGHYESYNSQGDAYGAPQERAVRKRYENTFDLLEYWKIYSKAGFGDRLKLTDKRLPHTTVPIEQFGDWCYIVVAPGIPFPLNLPSPALETDDLDGILERVGWPIPFYTDGGWPCARLSFYNDPDTIWPVSLIKPAIGEIRFVNWCMSFLADKVAAGSKTLVGVMKSAAEDIRQQIAGQRGPYQFVEIAEIVGKQRLDQIISFLNAPTFDHQIWTMVAQVLELIDKRLGLTELAYGMTTASLRSATEADVKQQNLNIRPDHMANQVEDWISKTCVKEIQAARWMLSAEDVAPVLGQLGAYVWETQIAAGDVDAVVRDFDYRVEAGSARKPNKNNRIRQLMEFGQVAMPTMQALALEGMVDPLNAYFHDIGQAMELDVSQYLIRLPPPLPPEQQPPSPEEVKANLERERAEQEMALRQEEAQLEAQERADQMAMKQAEHALKIEEMKVKLAFQERKQQLDLAAQEQRIAAEQRAAEAERAALAQEAQLEQRVAREKARTEIETTRAKSKAQTEAAQAQAQAKKQAARESSSRKSGD